MDGRQSRGCYGQTFKIIILVISFLFYLHASQVCTYYYKHREERESLCVGWLGRQREDN